MPLPFVERSEEEIAETIKKKVEAMKEVEGVRQLTVRLSGKRIDVVVLVLLGRSLEWEEAHRISLDIEREIIDEFPNARVTIHSESAGEGSGSVWKLVKDVAEGTPGSRGVHNIHVQRIDEKLCVDLHLEVSANMTVKQAHEVAEQVEARVEAADPSITEVTVHIESAVERVSREMAGVETELNSYIEHLSEHFPEIKEICRISIRRFGDALHLVLKCRFDPNLSIEKAHEIATKLEKEIRNDYPKITRIDIHEEPA